MSLIVAVKEEVTSVGKMTKKYSTKRQDYIAPCDLIKTRDFITVVGFPGLIKRKRDFFMEHKHCIEKIFCWLLCFSPFNTLIYLLDSFFPCFITIPLITPCNNPYVCSD